MNRPYGRYQKSQDKNSMPIIMKPQAVQRRKKNRIGPLMISHDPKHVVDKLPLFYKKLFKSFGPQDWWPGDTAFEIIVGAILTQNTNWGNVERAIQNLKKHKLLNPKSIHEISERNLAKYIKSAGFFRPGRIHTI